MTPANLDTIIPEIERERVIVRGVHRGETMRWIWVCGVCCTWVRCDDGRCRLAPPADLEPDLAWVPPDMPSNVVPMVRRKPA